MTANVLRDAETLPALQSVVRSGFGGYLDHVSDVLIDPYGARGRRRERMARAANAAVSFQFWRALASLGDAEAAELGAGLVEFAASR